MRNIPLKAFVKSPLKDVNVPMPPESGGGGTEKGSHSKRIVKNTADKFKDNKNAKGAGRQIVNTGNWSG